MRLQSYTGRIKLMIERAWLPPSHAASNLRAVVHLTIDKQGRVEQLRVVQSSGNTMFDQSLIRAIKQVSPLPPPPEDPNEPSLEAVIQFRQPS